jgi:histidyl-tRNA synthetase
LIIERIFREANILGLTVHINDRRILLAAAKYAGFDESQYGSVLIALDKNDKIGLSGVSDELLKMGFDQSSVEKFISLFDKPIDNISAREFCNSLAVFSPEDDVVDNLETIADTVKNNLSDNCRVIFDPTLVRGMGYYTGPIFECKVSGFGSSVAGGGRYDKMIGKISGGNDVAACGFSIGFERIVTILEEANFTPKISADKTAFLVDRKVSVDQLTNILNQAAGLRQLGNIVSVATMSKNVKFQIEMMEKNGYTKFEKFYPEK